MADGYAIKVKGELSVSTVSPTERGAKVNWLWPGVGITVLDQTTDAKIDRWWRESKEATGAECVKVKIVEVQL